MKLRKLLTQAAPYRKSLIAVGILNVVSSMVLLSIPWLAGQMIGSIMTQAPLLGRLVSLLILSLLVLAALNIAVSIVSSTSSARILADLRVRVYERLQRLPLDFHENHRQGDTLALATFEVARLSQFLTATLVSLPSRVLTALGAVLFMFRIDARLAFLVPLLVPTFYFILKVVGRRLRSLALGLQKAEAELVAITEENLEMLPAIKSFAREDLEADRYRSQVNLALELRIQEGRIYAVLEPIIGLVAAISAVLLLYAAGLTAQSGNMTPTELFSFLFYAALLTRPVGALAHVYGETQSAGGTLERLQSVLETEPEPGYSANGSMNAAVGHIEFENVGFGYPGREVTLCGVNLEIRAGEKIAVTGRNGAGKTTLITLLLRFRDPDFGAIYLDGKDISTLSVQELRRQIGVVPQRALLFNGTIRENITYGNENATEEEIEKAALLSQAHAFIVALPNGFQTEIGDHGVRLSGGQRQRIALARALLKNPPILILDEATSMFDLDGELAFIEEIASALEGRTVILITHRPASLEMADRIISVESGLVREIGTDDERVAAAIP